MFSAMDNTFATLIVGTIIWLAGVAFFLSLATSGIDMRVRAEPPVLPLAHWEQNF